VADQEAWARNQTCDQAGRRNHQRDVEQRRGPNRGREEWADQGGQLPIAK
jgi:hypothetical protein